MFIFIRRHCLGWRGGLTLSVCVVRCFCATIPLPTLTSTSISPHAFVWLDLRMPRLSQAATNAASAESQQEVVMAAEGIENYELPKALVTRIAKSSVSLL